jgi:hypothetical protein
MIIYDLEEYIQDAWYLWSITKLVGVYRVRLLPIDFIE